MLNKRETIDNLEWLIFELGFSFASILWLIHFAIIVAPYMHTNPFFSFILVFKQVDGEFLSIARQDCSPDGATCLMGLILNGRLTIANIGDSIATLVHKNGLFT